MGDKLVKQTILGVAWQDGRTASAATQQPVPVGQIQFAFGFLAAMTANATLDENRLDMIFENFQAARHLGGMIGSHRTRAGSVTPLSLLCVGSLFFGIVG